MLFHGVRSVRAAVVGFSAYAVLLACLAPGTPATAEPSFGCSGDLSRVEVVICTTESLALLDQRLTAVYKRRYDALSGSARSALAREQKEWIRRRDDCSLDKVCLREAYDGRIRGSTSPACSTCLSMRVPRVAAPPMPSMSLTGSAH